MHSARVLYEIYGCMAKSTGPDQTAPLSSLIRICTIFLDIFFLHTSDVILIHCLCAFICKYRYYICFQLILTALHLIVL